MVTIVGTQVAAVEGEQVVKTYHCTSFSSRLLGVAAEGFLEVTNKRVMLQATSKGSLIHSEVPIEDVAGLSLFKGNHFSLKHFLAAGILGLILGSLIGGLVSAFAGLIDDEYMVLPLLTGIGLTWWAAKSEEGDIAKPLKAIIAASVLQLGAGAGMVLGMVGSLFGGGGGGPLSFLGMLGGIGVGIWALIVSVKYAIRPTMTLAVNSKGGSNTPIAISGPGFGAVASNAARALEAEPAEDAEQMMKELGALILDIQQRGDFGMEKWRAAGQQDRPILGQRGGKTW